LLVGHPDLRERAVRVAQNVRGWCGSRAAPTPTPSKPRPLPKEEPQQEFSQPSLIVASSNEASTPYSSRNR